MTQSAHLPAYTQPEIKRKLIEEGASGTIYALSFPESRQIVEEVIDGCRRDEVVNDAVHHAIKAFNSATCDMNDLASYIAESVNKELALKRQEFTGIYEAAWTGRQDDIHKHFFEAWKEWSAPVVNFNPAQWNYAYPTAGAGEGLKDCINQYGAKARVKNFEPTIHLFYGEYEGFKAQAEATGIKFVWHDRANWKDTISKIGPNDQFYISQPSAIDGNIWEEFDSFAEELSEKQPAAQIMLDLTYVGSVAKDYKISADHDNIPSVIFSLSKPFGVYYHRIGGIISREPIPSLVGNIWFKNIQSLQVGTALLKRSTVFDLAAKYKPFQDQAIANVNERLGLELKPSDVILFATDKSTEANDQTRKALLRGSPSAEFIRVCVTPEIARLAPGCISIDLGSPTISPPSAIHGTSLKDLMP